LIAQNKTDLVLIKKINLFARLTFCLVFKDHFNFIRRNQQRQKLSYHLFSWKSTTILKSIFSLLSTSAINNIIFRSINQVLFKV